MPFHTRLPNGLTLLVQPVPGVASAALGLAVTVGSRHESRAEAGLSHLLEHLMFQGTRRRDNRELSRVLCAVGGNLDASTSREQTVYYAKVPAAHLSLAVDVLADMMAHSLLAPGALKKEQRVILEEIRMVEDEPEERVHDLFAEALWPGHALGQSVLGTRAQVERYGRPDLVTFRQRHYRPERMILAVAGRVTPAAVLACARRCFGGLSGSDGRPDAAGEALPQAPARPLVRWRRLEQVHVCLGGQGVRFADKRRLTMLALSNVLGGGTSSRLFYAVREKRALAYAIYSFLDFFQDTGMLGVYFACDPKNFAETLRVIRGELARLSEQPITPKELRDLREQMKGNLLLSLENSSAHMWRMLQHEMYQQRYPALSATLRAIDRLNRSDIQEAAKKMFKEQPLTLATVGPVSEKKLPGWISDSYARK